MLVIGEFDPLRAEAYLAEVFPRHDGVVLGSSGGIGFFHEGKPVAGQGTAIVYIDPDSRMRRRGQSVRVVSGALNDPSALEFGQHSVRPARDLEVYALGVAARLLMPEAEITAHVLDAAMQRLSDAERRFENDKTSLGITTIM